ncbi:MAG: rhomboid family protein [bacterium]
MNSKNSIKNSQCLLHPDREAVAICLSCNNYFCRECVTEHKGKVLCKPCLYKGKRKSVKRKKVPLLIRAASAILVGLFMCYFLFYSLGYTLSIIPDKFHQGDYFEQN